MELLLTMSLLRAVKDRKCSRCETCDNARDCVLCTKTVQQPLGCPLQTDQNQYFAKQSSA
jgi:hypothetical protein